MELVGKRVLVTGGGGFIGSHLVEALAAKNEVTVVDNLSSACEGNGYHAQDSGACLVNSDIRDLGQMRKLLRGNQVVFHLAVQGLRVSLFDPYLVHEVNATGTLNILQAAREAGVQKFIYVSSSEVYGTAKITPMKESHPLEPTTPYGASKLAGEAYARAFYLSFGLPVVIVRPFNTYGPREHLAGVYGEVIPRFVLRVMNGLPPIIFGDGRQTRDFTDVRDTVRGIVLAAESDSLVGDTVNIAAGKEVSVGEIARIVLNLLGRDGHLAPLHLDPRPGDVRQHYADISKAGHLLKFRPRVSIEDGIGHYVDWVRGQHWDLEHLQEREVIMNWRSRDD